MWEVARRGSAWAGGAAFLVVGAAGVVAPGLRGWVLALALTAVNGAVWAYVFARQLGRGATIAAGDPAAPGADR